MKTKVYIKLTFNYKKYLISVNHINFLMKTRVKLYLDFN
jgi:hypothetical protein